MDGTNMTGANMVVKWLKAQNKSVLIQMMVTNDSMFQYLEDLMPYVYEGE